MFDPGRVIMMLLIMLVVPVATGMLIRARRPETADTIRPWSRRIAGAVQNVALAIGMAVVFFPALAGVAITSILWGVVHRALGFALAAIWMHVPLAEGSPETS